jgi:mannose-6-phosphate isomerase-like protein (cupin superfamily)
MTPTQVHAGELVVLALGGTGRLKIDGGQQRFSGHCTLAIPPGESFEIGNCGATALQTIWIYTRKPTPFDGGGNLPDQGNTQ